MRKITTTSGTPVETDGDVLAIIEAVSRDLSRRADLDYSFEEIDQEIQHLISQLTQDELRTYLKESLFMSFNRYENDRLSQLVRKATDATEGEA